MQKAVFIDRDGVINSDVGHYYIYKPEDFVLNEGVIEALQQWQKKGLMIIIISNQGGIARGTFTKADVEKVHQKLIRLLLDKGINITEIYYCPHHDKFERCLCRKPGSLMIEKAMARFNINPEKSYMIGDHQKDIDAGAKVGLKTIKIDSNQSLMTIAHLVT